MRSVLVGLALIAIVSTTASGQERPTQREASYRVELQFRQLLIPEVAQSLPGMQRPAPDTIAFSAETMPRAYMLVRVLYRYINPD